MELYANNILKEDKIQYLDISEDTKPGQEYLEAIYFLNEKKILLHLEIYLRLTSEKLRVA